VAGRKAYDRASYLTDVRVLRRRGWTWDRIAKHLGVSKRTLHRMVRGQ
jgi:AraC-like DNA-binding protein